MPTLNYKLTKAGKICFAKATKYWPYKKKLDYEMCMNQLRSQYTDIRKCAIASLFVECRKRECELIRVVNEIMEEQ